MHKGTVESWFGDEGWGVIASDVTPGGCWVSFGAIVMDGYLQLVPDDEVDFTFEVAWQDGYAFRAVQVWPPGVEPGTTRPYPPSGPSSAYSSTLTIVLDDATMPSGEEIQHPE